MHCISLAILSRLSRFPSPAVGTNWLFCVDMPLNSQSINQSINVTISLYVTIPLYVTMLLCRYMSLYQLSIYVAMLLCRYITMYHHVTVILSLCHYMSPCYFVTLCHYMSINLWIKCHCVWWWCLNAMFSIGTHDMLSLIWIMNCMFSLKSVSVTSIAFESVLCVLALGLVLPTWNFECAHT